MRHGAIGTAQARRELLRLAELGTVTADRPGWVMADDQPDAWLDVGGGIALPLQFDAKTGELVAVSTLARGCMPDEARSIRNRTGAPPGERQRTRKRASRGWSRPRPEPQAEEWTT